MKFPIDWHENCLQNLKNSLSEAEQRFRRERAKLDKLEADVVFYQNQIDEARRRKLDGFDSDRLLGGRR